MREPILYSFVLSSPPGQNFIEEPKIKHFKEMNKPGLSHITFYLEDEDQKPVTFIGEMILLSCQLVKI